jgi:hypothetical protein
MYTALVSRLGSTTLAIETPNLGRVEYLRPQDVYAALNFLRQEAAASSGAAVGGVFVCGYDRGLGPKGGC